MPLVAAGQPTADSDAGPTREWLVPFPVDVPLTLSVHRHGGGDPAYATDAAGAVWRTSLTPDGPGTLRVRSRGAVVTAQAWGPGADWLLDRLPAQLGFHDDRTGFTACHPVVGELALRYEGLRVGCGGRVFEALVPADLGAHTLLGLAPGRRRGRTRPDDHRRRGGRGPARAGA